MPLIVCWHGAARRLRIEDSVLRAVVVPTQLLSVMSARKTGWCGAGSMNGICTG